MASRSALVSVLFTDVVGSTEIAEEVGDRAWRELRTRHHRIVRRELRRFGGTEVDTAGDGFFAIFDRPTQAVRCAVAACEGVREIGLELRAGVHVGEIERTKEGVSGIAVHLGARIGAAAGRGEVLVSDTVRQLTRGSGIVLEDRGVHALKGVPESQALFSVSEVDGNRVDAPLDPDEARVRRGSAAILPPAKQTRRVALVAGAAFLVVAAATTAILATRSGQNLTPPAGAPSAAGTVVRIDPETNEVVERIPGLLAVNEAFSPPQIEVGEGGVWVLSGAQNVRHVDPSTGEVTSIDIGGAVGAITLGHGRLWATGGVFGGNEAQVYAISPGSLTVDETRSIETPPAHRTFLLAVTEDAIWAASQGSLTRIDPIGGYRLVAEGLPEDDMVGAGDDLWLVDRLGNRLARFDVGANDVVQTVPLQASPDQLAIAEDGTLWVLDEFQRTVTPVSADGDVGRSVPVGEDPLAVAAWDDIVWVGGRDDRIHRIDPGLDRVVSVIDVGADVQAIDVDAETGEVWAYLARGPVT